MSGDVATIAIIASMLGAIVLVAIALYVLLVVAYWKIFKKMGVAGWKSIIPVYNEYILFKQCWKTSFFWISIALMVVGGIMVAVDPGTTTTYAYEGANVSVTDHGMLYACGQLIVAIGGIIDIICWYYLGKSFGHGAGFLVASIFFPNITTLYLGFNHDEYLGNTTQGTIEA